MQSISSTSIERSQRREARLPEELELLPEALRRHASQSPQRPAFSFLSDTGQAGTQVSYADLDRRARAIAGTLQRLAEPGSRVLMPFPPGLDFLAAFMGCQYAAMAAVPMQPPRGLNVLANGSSDGPAAHRAAARLQKLAGIVEDCDARVVLTSAALAANAYRIAAMEPALGVPSWVSADDIDDESANEWRQPSWHADDLSLLQYTSGSTSSPKGVVVAHRHISANAAAIRELARFDPTTDIGVSWLPPYHDMGLIGNMLQQILEGYPQILLSPLSFIKRPLVWLRALSEHRATISAAPNFAFEVCAEKATAEDVAGLDLSQVRLIVVGAEPIRAASLARFAEVFAPAGFDAQAFHPCYGLAESTLIVTGRRGVETVDFDAVELRHGHARLASEPSRATRPLVSCGSPLSDASLRIVDPQSLEPCRAGRVGEIWVASSHVAGGYFGQPETSAGIFEATLPDCERMYLRTGDAGVLHDGQLFVTGRYKDVLIVGGANHHPHDIEASAAQAHPDLGVDRTIAFSTTDEDEHERVVVGVELRRFPEEERSALASEIRRLVLSDHALHIAAVVALRPGEVPRTTSGKPQRYLARQRYDRGMLGEII